MDYQKNFIQPYELSGKVRQGSKVKFKWHGSDSIYTGRIEMMPGTEIPYFVNEFNYNESPDLLEAMKYYNSLSSFAFFTEFTVLEF